MRQLQVTYLHITRVPKQEEKKGETGKNIFKEIMAERYLNLMKTVNTHN